MRIKRAQPVLISNEVFKVSATCLLFSSVGVLSYAAYHSTQLNKMMHASIIKELSHMERELDSIDHEMRWIASRPNQRF
jgi:hypothetical protein